MAFAIVIRLVFLLLAILGQETNATNTHGFILLPAIYANSSSSFSSISTSTCLVRGPPAIRRHDYTYTSGIGGHKVHTYGATWNMGRKICEQEGGYLAIINSRAEAELIGRLFQASRPHVASDDQNYANIGYHDLFAEGEFVTVHGEPLRTTGYYEWQGGGADNAAGNQNCGAVFTDGMLNDNYCHTRNGFICELPYVEG